MQKEKTEQVFYVTETTHILAMDKKLPEGTRYHKSKECSYLHRRQGAGISEMTEQEIVDAGSKLIQCAHCFGSKKEETKVVVKDDKTLPPTVYPTPHQVIIWECSDGREFTGATAEVEALRYELEITKKRLSNLDKRKKS